MKLNDKFVKHTVNGETVLVPVDGAPFHGLVQGNKTVGAILDCLEMGADRDGIVDALCERFSGDRAVIEEDVENVIEKLRKIGAIDE